ncbi:MAG: RNA polymerase, sigma-24 subunit, ECF subfamily [Parcubacteria group bacterium GW2011_GWA2_47_64]|nr:MAG: RNA polymerase, sigma-24 subunit, ECF subfamily [Parcubacteria group bacterium GW2011_GWA2_47_64]
MKERNEHAQFERIYQDTADMLFRFCFVKVSDREVALDLTQEAFTRLYETMQIGKVIDHPRAWLFKISRNLVIDWYRKKKPISLEQMMEQGGEAIEPADKDGREHIELSSEAKLVIKAFEKLGEEFREVLYLRYVEDLEPKEIARMLGLTANLVSVRISRGMEELRKIMRSSVLHEGIKSPYWSPYSIIMRVRENKLYALSFAIILLVSGGGSVVLAAERSVPGDILYPIKVKITEPALDKLYVTAEENARWQGEKTARRLREAETLAIQGKLDEEKSRVIEEKIKEHTEEFRAVIQDISTTTESETRESVEVEYESKVKAHSMILSKIKENNEEEAKPTIQHVENTLSTELQRNETRKEERVREKKEKESSMRT